MSCPLYKRLKKSGTTVYAFPGFEEDKNQVGDNYKLSFSKFALINLPKSQTSLTNEPKYWDFENSLFSSSPQPADNFADRTVNSLRNYVANQEVTIRNSKISNNEYFYDNSILSTNAEKIFFKWAKKLNLIQFEPAIGNDEYFSNLDEFKSNDINDSEYLNEYLWKEREIADNIISFFYESSSVSNKLEIEYNGSINYKTGDFIKFTDVSNVNFPEVIKYAEVISVIEPTGSNGYKVIFDIEYVGNLQYETNGYSNLVYNKLIRYVGEIQGNANVVSNNLSFDQIMSFVPDNAGETPDILFRTNYDENYSPNLQFPILPSQFQAEIRGSENFNSPILNSPQNYPGDQYAQYDNDDNLNSYNYLTSNGDQIRKTGDYFGVNGDVNNISFDGSNIDGVGIDFDTDHYVKMNTIGEEITNFDEFNTKKVNGQFPKDFEFNAILWYYTVEDINGNSSTNLYGISFIDHPDSNILNTSTSFPNIKKVVATDQQDGTSYQFTLNKHTTINNENPQPVFDNTYVNNLFGFNLYNEAMKRLITINDSTQNIVSENKEIMEKVNDLRQLIYTSSDIESVKSQITELNKLLRLYSTNQMVSTESISVERDDSLTPPQIKLYNVEGKYSSISNLKVSNLYNEDGYIPKSIQVPKGKDFMINISNDDVTTLELPNDQKISIFLNQDLSYKQTVDIIINSTSQSTENKKLDIFISSNNGTDIPVLEKIVSDVNLPIYFNKNLQNVNTSYKWKKVSQDVSEMKLNNDGETLSITCNRVRGLKKGDVILMENTLLGSDDDFINISGQYLIDSVDEPNNILNLDYTQNDNLNSYIEKNISDGEISSGDELTEYNTMGYISINKGYKISITRVDESDSSNISDRYIIMTTSLE